MTGATGTIGAALVPRLLTDPHTTVQLLLRARDEADLHRRLSGMMAYWGIECGDARARRIEVIRGDISQPLLGLEADAFTRLAAESTHIIHCAASVNLLMPLEQAQATSVVPTRTVLALGRLGIKAGRLRKIDFVSTVGVWGCTPGTMLEQPLPEVREFHNTYEAAKAEAERVIWAESDGLPVTVHRPSMVVGETGSGRALHFQVFYHLCEFLSGVRTFGIMPVLGHTRLDTIPVDWVASAIDWASRHEQTAGRIFHLCSGPEGAIELPRLQQRVRALWRQRGRNVPTLRTVPRRLLGCLVPVIGAVAGEKTRRALRALPPVLAYLAEDQGFSNGKTAAALAAAGLPVPAVETYLDDVLRFYLQTRFGGTTG